MILVSENHGADERPISFGDSTILFIRLTFANADDDFEWRKSVTSTSATACAESQNAKAARYGQHKNERKIPCSSKLLKVFRSKVWFGLVPIGSAARSRLRVGSSEADGSASAALDAAIESGEPTLLRTSGWAR
jgi:hypothetical protein